MMNELMIDIHKIVSLPNLSINIKTETVKDILLRAAEVNEKLLKSYMGDEKFKPQEKMACCHQAE